ncbi:hypothetical protein TNCV_2734451 [Trichonephila clavipes]|nr:hypothetical protein TNCV_2734451 [Trichonephila clavipes]
MLVIIEEIGEILKWCVDRVMVEMIIGVITRIDVKEISGTREGIGFDDRRFNDRGYQIRNRGQNDNFSRGDDRNRGSSENFSRGDRRQRGRLNALKVSDVKSDQTLSINEVPVKPSAICMSPVELPYYPIFINLQLNSTAFPPLLERLRKRTTLNFFFLPKDGLTKMNQTDFFPSSNVFKTEHQSKVNRHYVRRGRFLPPTTGMRPGNRAPFLISTATEHLKRPFPDWLVTHEKLSPSLRAGKTFKFLLKCNVQQASAEHILDCLGLSREDLYDSLPSCYRFFEGQQLMDLVLLSDN